MSLAVVRVTPFDQELAPDRECLRGGAGPKKSAEKPKIKKSGREWRIAARSELKRAEERIEKITVMHGKLQEKLSDPKLYEDHNAADLAVWQKKFHEVETALLRAEKLWLNGSETVENLENV